MLGYRAEKFEASVLSAAKKKLKVDQIIVDSTLGLLDNARLDFGGVPERPKGADCKSAGSTFGGSNPPPSTILVCAVAGHGLAVMPIEAGVVQW